MSGPGAWAPWISDPDPPQEIMTAEESKAAARKVAELMDRKRREEAEAAKQPVKGYIIPVGKRPSGQPRRSCDG
jgi:hypothetical protein